MARWIHIPGGSGAPGCVDASFPAGPAGMPFSNPGTTLSNLTLVRDDGIELNGGGWIQNSSQGMTFLILDGVSASDFDLTFEYQGTASFEIFAECWPMWLSEDYQVGVYGIIQGSDTENPRYELDYACGDFWNYNGDQQFTDCPTITAPNCQVLLDSDTPPSTGSWISCRFSKSGDDFEFDAGGGNTLTGSVANAGNVNGLIGFRLFADTFNEFLSRYNIRNISVVAA